MFSGRIRKWLSNSLAPNCPFTAVRMFLYRLSGFKIGKGTFIGMHSYLDDLCYEWITIGKNVTISYGVCFACHGKNQPDYSITIKDGAYIGMRASIISKNAGGGGEYFRRNNRGEFYSWCLYISKQRCARWINRCWSSLQNYREVVNHRNEVITA